MRRLFPAWLAPEWPEADAEIPELVDTRTEYSSSARGRIVAGVSRAFLLLGTSFEAGRAGQVELRCTGKELFPEGLRVRRSEEASKNPSAVLPTFSETRLLPAIAAGRHRK